MAGVATSPIVSVDEVRRFGYHWYAADIAFRQAAGMGAPAS